MVANTPFRAAVLLIATSLAGAATAPAQAQSNQSPVTVLGHPEALTRIVPFGDLALATTAGQRSLVHRVSSAVREVCPDSSYGTRSTISTTTTRIVPISRGPAPVRKSAKR